MNHSLTTHPPETNAPRSSANVDRSSREPMRNDDPASLVHNQEVRDLLATTLWQIGGYACAGDVATSLGSFTPDEIKPILDDMVEAGSIEYEDPDFSAYDLDDLSAADLVKLKSRQRIYRLG